jgi:hypothetical protein
MKNLLITTIGNYNLLGVWSYGKIKNFDIITIDYTQDPTFKYPGIYKALQSLRDYDYYWMPDEDICLSTSEINKLFDIASTYHLDLFQPSVLEGPMSFPSWPMFIHRKGPEMVSTPFVEIMCPGFSRDGLLRCIDTFPKSNSGWGLDIIWAKLLGYQKMGLINSVVVKHSRKPMNGSNLYRILQEPPSTEMYRLLREYEVMMIPYVHKDSDPPSSMQSTIRRPIRRPNISPRELLKNTRMRRHN